MSILLNRIKRKLSLKLSLGILLFLVVVFTFSSAPCSSIRASL